MHTLLYSNIETEVGYSLIHRRSDIIAIDEVIVACCHGLHATRNHVKPSVTYALAGHLGARALQYATVDQLHLFHI